LPINYFYLSVLTGTPGEYLLRNPDSPLGARVDWNRERTLRLGRDMPSATAEDWEENAIHAVSAHTGEGGALTAPNSPATQKEENIGVPA
jgi:hypothetical protein